MKIVLALGGNALGNDPRDQEGLTRKTAAIIVDLIEEGNQLVITHGNGPQVGLVLNAFKALGQENIGFSESVAMTQGYIGYHLQKALIEEFRQRNISREAISLVTEIEVDPEDPGFSNPSKPIGGFYSQEEVLNLREANKDYVYKEDSGRGYRRVVASPRPKAIVERQAIEENINQGHTIITCGGGGIPVVKKDRTYEGIDCIIDKDLASSFLAKDLDFDCLMILTAVEHAYLNFNSDQEEALTKLSVEELRKYKEEGHFAPGSMLPKVEAVLDFVGSSKGRLGIISSLDQALRAYRAETGTRVES